MTAKEYLLSDKCEVKSESIAKRMYPTNKNANSYLSRKLAGKSGRSWTDKDEQKALKAFEDLAISLPKP